ELRRTGRRQEPVEGAAERDEAHAVLLPEVASRERGGASKRIVERACARLTELREGVEEDDDVGVPLGVVLVDPELPAPRAGTPVDAAGAVARHERPEGGGL